MLNLSLDFIKVNPYPDPDHPASVTDLNLKLLHSNPVLHTLVILTIIALK